MFHILAALQFLQSASRVFLALDKQILLSHPPVKVSLPNFSVGIYATSACVVRYLCNSMLLPIIVRYHTMIHSIHGCRERYFPFIYPLQETESNADGSQVKAPTPILRAYITSNYQKTTVLVDAIDIPPISTHLLKARPGTWTVHNHPGSMKESHIGVPDNCYTRSVPRRSPCLLSSISRNPNSLACLV
ncbi:hypothetical protein F4604DRAFT_1702574 [Suillus subluteus]|nr:hypothetical protein F4604DRAFT_1702574 [Suillus subluteus]